MANANHREEQERSLVQDFSELLQGTLAKYFQNTMNLAMMNFVQKILEGRMGDLTFLFFSFKHPKEYAFVSDETMIPRSLNQKVQKTN